MNASSTYAVLASLIVCGVFARLLPHVPNATPLTAIALIGGLYVGKRWSIILPLSILILSDIVVGFYDVRILLSVYGSFALIGCLPYIGRRYQGVLSTGIRIGGSSVIFFLITNTAVWMFSPWYEKSIAGLFYSYELGLPFFRNMFMGDVAYSILLVGVFGIIRSIVTAKRKHNLHSVLPFSKSTKGAL